MEMDLVTPFWYPGDEAWLVFNKLWVPLFGVFALVSIITIYKVIRDGWAKYLVAPFIVNIIGAVLFAVFVARTGDIVPGVPIAFFMLVSVIVQVIGLWGYSRVLSLLCTPYLVWLIIMNLFYFELMRLNVL